MPKQLIKYFLNKDPVYPEKNYATPLTDNSSCRQWWFYIAIKWGGGGGVGWHEICYIKHLAVHKWWLFVTIIILHVLMDKLAVARTLHSGALTSWLAAF